MKGFVAIMNMFDDYLVVEHGVDNLNRRVCKVEYIPTHEVFLLADGGHETLANGQKRRLALYGAYVPQDAHLHQKVREVARIFFDKY